MKRLTEISIEVLLALGVVVSIFLISLYVPKEKQIDVKWVGLFFHTLTVFGFLIHWLKPSLKAWRFWGLFMVFLAIHIALFVALLNHVDHWPLLLFVVAAGIEWSITVPLLRAVKSGRSENQRTSRMSF